MEMVQILESNFKLAFARSEDIIKEVFSWL